MLIVNDQRYIETSFRSEDEIESVVLSNFEYLFGSSSFIIPKTLIKTNDGAGTIPDSFVIDVAKRQWYLVEVETSKHSVWSHIAPQVSKQIIASQQVLTRKLIAEISINLYSENREVAEIFQDEDISEIDIRKCMSEILEKEPIIGIPIDKISKDLEEWAKTLKSVVKLWIVKKYVQLDNPNHIIYEFPEEYKPQFDTEIESGKESSKTITYYDVTLSDIVESGLLSVNQELYMTYGFKSAEKKKYTAVINNEHALVVSGETFESPSYAALFCINNYGSTRKTVNGWTSWKNRDGRTLAQVREEYLKNKK